MVTTGSRPRAARVRVAVFGGALVLAGLGAAAAGSVAGELTTSASTTAVRLVLLVAGAVVVGLGLVRSLVGGPGTAYRRVAWTAGLSAAAAALAGYLHGDVVRTGTLAWVLAAVLVPVALETRFARWAAVAALPGAGLVAVTLGSGHSGVAFAADVVHAVAATVLVGLLTVRAVAAVSDPCDGRALGALGPAGDEAADGADTRTATGGPDDDLPAGPATAPGRPDLIVVSGLVAAAVAVLAAVARIVAAGPFSVTDLVGTAYGRAALAALLLPAVVVPLLVADRRTAPRCAAPAADGAARRDGVRHTALTGVSSTLVARGVPRTATTGAGGTPTARRAGAAAAAAIGVAAASVAGLLPAPAPAAVPGQALLRTVSLDGENVPIMIAPMRPGPNLVQLGGSGYPVAGSSAAAAGAEAVSDVPGPAATGTAGPGDSGSSAAVPGHDGGTGHDSSGHGAGTGHDMTSHGGRAMIEAGSDPVSFVSRPGARGGWAVVDIPAGTGSVTVRMGGDSATVPVAVGDTGASGSVSAALTGRDGPECASAVTGAALARGPETGPVESCPAQTLDPEQASDLRATMSYMAQKGARSVRVVADPSPRSVAAARLVREEGTRAGLTFPQGAENDPDSALVVVSGWEQAVATLDETGARARTTPTHLGGTFLAPWLLTGDVLRQTASAFLPLSFAPNEPDAQRYALALGATYPDTAPSASGFLAWARASGTVARATDDRPSLYGAAAVNVPMSIEPPGSTGHHGGPDPASWYPGGTVVPVTGPLEGSP